MSTGDHGHVWDVAEQPCTEISPEVCLTPVGPVAPTGDAVHDVEGYWFCHDVPGQPYRCHGRVITRSSNPTHPTWTQTGTLDGGDLTLTPSVLCATARYGSIDHPEVHGWVRDGKWVTA